MFLHNYDDQGSGRRGEGAAAGGGDIRGFLVPKSPSAMWDSPS
eukprot:SAG11_NODE_38554_length_251_cov_11.848684_1_plen_42_part_10